MLDVLIIGGGPAGSAAARLLARWGHEVLLLTRPERPALRLAESLPLSITKPLRVIDVQDQVERFPEGETGSGLAREARPAVVG